MSGPRVHFLLIHIYYEVRIYMAAIGLGPQYFEYNRASLWTLNCTNGCETIQNTQ